MSDITSSREENAWINFYVIGQGILPHLATALRHWMEAVAVEEYRLAHGRLPEVNAARAEIRSFEKPLSIRPAPDITLPGGTSRTEEL